MLSPIELFSLYGNVIPLNINAPMEVLHSDLVEEIKV